ncbi:MAG: DUF4325 domain-containing protein [Thermodesulfobacteriota bacterium]
MAKLPKRSQEIRRFILENLRQHPTDILKVASERFRVSRQAISGHLKRLVDEGSLVGQGTRRTRRYSLRVLVERDFSYNLRGLAEDIVWRRDIAPLLADLRPNVKAIWQFGVTEMLNNAIDHSGGTVAIVRVKRTAVDTAVDVVDDGEGIFAKIQREMGLEDEQHAILELHKGKLTTDPVNHTGEGIFFASRMFDQFFIVSGETIFVHDSSKDEGFVEGFVRMPGGTIVSMWLKNETNKTTKAVFDAFTDDDFGFTTTVVPVHLARYGEEALVSRSQAKRLLARFDKFRKVMLDFKGVKEIGRAFADEIFRVFAQAHPEVMLMTEHTNPDIDQMINQARRGLSQD